MEAAVLDAICDPESEFADYHTWLRVIDEAGTILGDSEPLVCGVNRVDLVASRPAGAGPANAPLRTPSPTTRRSFLERRPRRPDPS